MAVRGTIVKSVIELGGYKNPPIIDGIKAQKKELRKLLRKSKNTQFGQYYNFSEVLNSKDLIKSFQSNVPVFDYEKIHKAWWYKTQEGQEDVCWPGKIKYFALSSGTSGASSKYIPVTTQMIHQIKKTSIKQLLSLAQYNLPKELYTKGALMLGGSTKLKHNGIYYEGDLSGITTGNIPLWFQKYYYPGKKISEEREWQIKLNEIVKQAKNWDVAAIVGVPAWLQILMVQIMEEYNLNSIHDIWPNLSVFVHGGVAFKPYKTGFEKILKHPLVYIETYLASEGFIALQMRPNVESMQLVLNNGLFLEFVPFNEDNFDVMGDIKENPKALTIEEVEEGEVYALLLSSCAGAWRYLIGDTIKFTNKKLHEIQIVGRTKHYMSLCGEHLSQCNMNSAIEMMEKELNVDIKEFAISGIEHGTMFAHKWYIGTDDDLDNNKVAESIDKHLRILNDDYAVERIAAIKDVIVEVLPSKIFYDYLESIGKTGGSFKFPRVLRGEQLEKWENFLKNNYKK